MTQRGRALAALLAGALCSFAASGCNDYDEERGGGTMTPSPEQRPPQNRSSQPLSSPSVEEESFEATAEPGLGYHAVAGQPRDFSDHRSEVRIVTAEVESIPVLIPSTVVIAAGPDQLLRLHNQGSEDRRIVIEGLGVSENVAAGKEQTIHLPRLAPNSIYAIRIETASPTATATQPPSPPQPGAPEAPYSSTAERDGAAQAPAPDPQPGTPEASMQHGTLVVLGAARTAPAPAG